MSHFCNALQQIGGGDALADIDEQLASLLKVIRETGKKGTLTVSLTVKPNGERGFEVQESHKATAPQYDYGRSFFYPDKNGHLTRSAPTEEGATMLRPVDSGGSA